MNKSKAIYPIIAGGLVAVYAGYALMNYLNREKPQLIDLQKTKKILQEIKHQMLITCINFNSEMQKRAGQINFQDPQTTGFLRGEMSKIYQQKENLVLSKYNLDSQTLALALKSHANVTWVRETQKEIFDMMEKAISGRIPDLTVAPAAQNAFTKQQLASIYYQLCLEIVKKVLQRLQQCQAEDPNFDSRDDESFRKAIRSLMIYDFKVKFLAEKGFREAWGCPNETFFKLIENHKHFDTHYKANVVKIQKSYEKAIQQISKNPNSVSLSDVDKLFEDSDPNPARVVPQPVNKIVQVAEPTRQQYSIPSHFPKKQQPSINVFTSLRSEENEKSDCVIQVTDSIQLEDKEIQRRKRQQIQKLAAVEKEKEQEQREAEMLRTREEELRQATRLAALEKEQQEQKEADMKKLRQNELRQAERLLNQERQQKLNNQRKIQEERKDKEEQDGQAIKQQQDMLREDQGEIGQNITREEKLRQFLIKKEEEKRQADRLRQEKIKAEQQPQKKQEANQ